MFSWVGGFLECKLVHPWVDGWGWVTQWHRQLPTSDWLVGTAVSKGDCGSGRGWGRWQQG